MVGYGAVVEMANRAGMNYKIQPTPAVALGSYEITPLEAVGAYTVFSNQGGTSSPTSSRWCARRMARWSTRNKNEPQAGAGPARGIPHDQPDGRGAAQRHRGRRARAAVSTCPAAGKTGTSHDGWFAGYTSELLCVVWVGFDDNKELDLEGAHSAAPIWTEFMKRALAYREYRDAKPFRSAGRHCFHRYRSAIRNARHGGVPGAPG
jgi:penicillin-binding protein 1B